MGSVSSCCSTEPAKQHETIKMPLDGNHNSLSPGKCSDDGGRAPQGKVKGDNSELGPSDAQGQQSDDAITEFQKKLEGSIGVTVLLADGTNLPCELKLKPSNKSLVISCEANFRDIPLTDLKAILHGKDQLRRVETKACLTKDSNCVALHMMTGNCIPVRFHNVSDKECFIQLMARLKDSL